MLKKIDNYVLKEPMRVAINDYHPIIILKARKS